MDGQGAANPGGKERTATNKEHGVSDQIKVLFAIRNNGADGYFRAVAPASLLRYQGVQAEARTAAFEDAGEFDVLVLQRHCSEAAISLARSFQDRGKPVIYDVDDWLFGLPPNWPAYEDYYVLGSTQPRERILTHEQLLNMADVVTCTGATLAEKLSEHNDDVRVVPNCVMWADWDTVIPDEKRDASPVVGWFGMPYYWDSWRLMAPALEQVICEQGARLAILGYPDVVQVLSPKLRERTYVQPICRWDRFGQMRTMIASFDVGIAWLEDTPFNRCKSPLKVLQYGAAGVPVVASPMPYSEALSNEYPAQYGLIAETPEALYHGVTNCLAHPEPARARAAAWRDRVWTQHTYEARWKVWLELLESVRR